MLMNDNNFVQTTCLLKSEKWYVSIEDYPLPRCFIFYGRLPCHLVTYNVPYPQVVEEFKLHARERKFVVRDFHYNEQDLAAGKNEITKLVTDKKKQFVSNLEIYWNGGGGGGFRKDVFKLGRNT